MSKAVYFSSRRPCSSLAVAYIGAPVLNPGATVQFHRGAICPLTGAVTEATGIFEPIVDVLTGTDRISEFALVGREDRLIGSSFRVSQVRVPLDLSGDELANLIEMAALLAGLQGHRVNSSSVVLSEMRRAMS